VNDVRITFLGTSAGTPSRERNLAAVAVTMDGRTLLFDCGEGTQQQIIRSPLRFGAIESIFITHLHGDHLYGLPGLVATMGMHSRTAPLDVYGPPGLRAYFEAVRRTSQFNPAFAVDICEVGEGEVRRAGGYRVVAARLEHSIECLGFCVVEDDLPGTFDVHRARALGVPEGPLFGQLVRGTAVTLPDGRVIDPASVVAPPRPGRRIAYCTDTRPTPAAATLARDADVLIHEATYASDLAAEAEERFHSTATEAAQIAAAANAHSLILTHFSPRYRDVTPLVAEARSVFANTTAASDLLVVRLPTPPARPYTPPPRNSPAGRGS